MYMKLHEDIYGIWIYMKAYGCISATMTVYESRWSYMNVNGSKWIYMKIYKALRWYILGCMLSKKSKTSWDTQTVAIFIRAWDWKVWEGEGGYSGH